MKLFIACVCMVYKIGVNELSSRCSGGWKKDIDGKWVKDEEAEFDSDEEPPDLP